MAPRCDERGVVLARAVGRRSAFPPENREDKSLQARIAEARTKLEGKVEAPRTEAKEGVFLVQQDAVVGSSLVRYTVRVSKLGLPTVETTTLAEDLPVVSVG